MIYSEVLLKQELNPEAKEYVELVKFQSDKLKFLIDALVKAYRLGTVQFDLQWTKEALSNLIHKAVQYS